MYYNRLVTVHNDFYLCNTRLPGCLCVNKPELHKLKTNGLNVKTNGLI